jgi:hypothetical protein
MPQSAEGEIAPYSIWLKRLKLATFARAGREWTLYGAETTPLAIGLCG